MKNLIMSLGLAVSLVAPLQAQDAQSSVRQHLKQELPFYGFRDVDVDSLTSTQVMHINHLLHSNKTTSQIRGNIGAVLGDSLFSLFK